jgi:hypothetical protein
MNEFIAHRHRNLSKKGRYFAAKNTFLDYHWIPAKSWTPHSYTLVYFLGYNGTIPQNLVQNDSHNLLCIVDRSGPQSRGSWFFGSQGVPTTLNFVLDFITQLCQAELMISENIIFSGKGMGGHMALFCQHKFKSVASIVHNPTTNLVSSKYVEGINADLFKAIFSKSRTNDFQNLVKLIEKDQSSRCKIFITSDHDIKSTFYTEQILPILAQDNVQYLGKHQLFFDAIFHLIDDTFPPAATKFEIVRKTPSNSLKEIYPIHIKISSRPEVCIDKDLTFGFDPYGDRSWRFWYQNLCWLEEHLESLEDRKHQQDQFAMIFSTWMHHIVPDNEHNEEFFYHDHSLAYRAIHLMNCCRFASEDMLPDVKSHIRDIGTLLLSPLEDNSLSNHAYDQAVSLFLISHQLDRDDEYKHVWEKVALERLKRELEYSFTLDGVHVENSPSYHHGMIINIHKSLTKVLKRNPHPEISEHLEALEKSIPFLRWIIRPDGKVPPIGDSEEKQVSTTLAQKMMPTIFQNKAEGMQVFGKGYAIWRSDEKKFHMTLKSCQHGRFHRHDDDCSITLWSNEMNLVHDAGLLYYKERDPDRIFVRSAQGHSGFEVPKHKPIRNMLDRNAQAAKVEAVSKTKATGTQGMYANLQMTRTIDTDFQKVVIVDQFCQSSINKGVKQNFLLSHQWKIELLPNKVLLSDGKKAWSFLVEDEELMSSVTIEKVIISRLKNKSEPAHKLTFTPKSLTTRIVIQIEDEHEPENKKVGQKIALHHEKFGKTELMLPIDWSMNPHNSKNWMHHLNSLRWLGKNHPTEEIIADFYSYHFENKKRHAYFNTRAGDHTISIRLIQCCNMYEHVSAPLRSLLQKIIRHDISSLMKETVYRAGHNHGLMADVALLQATRLSEFCSKIIDVSAVHERAKKTLTAMFFSCGLTKEHSLSYQLWNLNYAMEFFKELSTDNYDGEIVEANFQTFSKEFIDHFLVDSTYQFPIGDSFRKLNLNLYQKIFSAKPQVVQGAYHNDQFSSARFENQYSQVVHATLVSGYNSHIHKQDDDLSFCLAIDGKIIIDDAGYTDTATAEQYAFLASTSAHSMLTLPGLEFKENQGKDASSVNPVTKNDGTYRLSGIHHRIPNTVVEREVLATSKGISINDSVMSSERLESQIVKRRFVINPEFNFEILDTRGVSITDIDGKEILFIQSKNASFTSFSEGVYVGQDKRDTRILEGFDLMSDLKGMTHVQIEFKKIDY